MDEYRVAVVHVVKAKSAEAAAKNVVGKVARKEMTEIYVKNITTGEASPVVLSDLTESGE